jgi:hypothetical protein
MDARMVDKSVIKDLTREGILKKRYGRKTSGNEGRTLFHHLPNAKDKNKENRKAEFNFK